ncbi:aldose 1-epimerase family protein [Fructilactobacillus cliffordii]|uniref:Aldose 1-epimerase family protein n=1 Tax=Fructilactobacillus cliffordii TaxID=2940299 RepID=A0A9Q9E3K8_9LACO|nr:aldose 1-epimerase family protein [Fructilactobacillus cliffordii]USS89633.1 aldose 1-epimerase family protein [Fructilactobacillus cliffordii]
MTVELRNDQLTIKIDELGAELVSVVRSGHEYIWNADPAHWKRHAPILFPIVGKLKNNQYQYQGQTYRMFQHGFARDQQFQLISKTADQAFFLLESNNETKEMYPFDFELVISYTLRHAHVEVQMTVLNVSESDELLYAIGAHPGFRVPLEKDVTPATLTVTPATLYQQVQLGTDGLTKTEQITDLFQQPVSLQHLLFQNDAQILNVKMNPKTEVTIAASDHKWGVTLTGIHNDYLGIWSTYPQVSNFVCLEPWWGVADSETVSGNLADKPDIRKLRPGAKKTFEFQLKFF